MSWSGLRVRPDVAFDGMPLQPVSRDSGARGVARCGPLRDVAKSFGAGLGSLSFHRIIQDASRWLIVGAAAKSSASSLGLDLFRSTGKNAL